MASKVLQLHKANKISPPKPVTEALIYEVVMGSAAYGLKDIGSDLDIYGICIPPKFDVFPHLRGEIPGFGRQKQQFEQYQQHHIYWNDESHDISIYNIIKFFSLAMENNPNIVDALFVPERCVLYATMAGQKIREERHIFLHKGAFHKFKGYAFSQKHKMLNKNPEGKRVEIIEKYGYDVKFAYHIVRLASEIEEILTTGTLTLDEKGRREHMKAIRKGEVPMEDVIKWFDEKELQLEKLYHSSTLQHSPDEEAIKKLLLEILEIQYGSVDDAIKIQDEPTKVLMQIKKLTDDWSKNL